jgi:hypothetical protein
LSGASTTESPATQIYVTGQIGNLVDSAPTALDTLNELAAAIGDDANYASTISTALGNRLRVDTASQGLDSTQKSNARTNLGLGTAATYAVGDFATAAQGAKADTAHGWGNHALAGYLTSLTSGNVTTALGYTPANDSSVVHITGPETITGEKTFTAIRTNISGGSLTLKSGTANRVIISSYNANEVEFGVTPSGTTYTSKFVFPNNARLYTLPDATGTLALTSSTVTIGSTAITLGSSATTIAGLSSVTSTTFVGALTGNASTATSAATWTTGRTITIGSTGKSVNGSGDVSWTLSEIGAATAAQGAKADTAHGWGNHASAGYLTSFSEADTLDSVTDRGASTTNNISIGALTTSGKITLGTFANSTTNTGEAWIGRASDRNAGTMTVQLGGNSVSNRYFEVVDYAWTTVLFSTTSGGDSTAASSLRAPLFYDSDNTNYFADPAGRSRLASIDYGDNGYYLGAGDWGWRHTTPHGWIQFGPANSGHAHIYTSMTNFYLNAPIQVNGVSMMTTDDIRTRIFYDVDNTEYYLDAASTSNLVGLTVANTITGRISGFAGAGSPKLYSTDSGYNYELGEEITSLRVYRGEVVSITDNEIEIIYNSEKLKFNKKVWK